MAQIAERVSTLEYLMEMLIHESSKTQMMLQEFQEESQANREADRKQMQEFQAEMRKFREENRADRKKMWKQWGELSHKMGTIVEDIVAPGLRGAAREYFNVDEFDYFAPRVRLRSEDRSETREFDVVAYTSDYFFLVETKTTARTNYISEFINFIPKISTWFPQEIKGKKLVPVFASLYLDENSITYLTRNKILAMATKDDSMDIYNPQIIELLSCTPYD